MAETLAIAGAIASVVGAGTSVLGGLAQNNAAQAERQQYEEERRNAQVAAAQAEEERRKDLARTLATQEAVRAGRGIDLFSATGTTIRDSTIADAEADIDNIRLNRDRAGARYGLAASAAGARGTAAIVGGVGNAAGSLLSGAQAYRTLTR